MLKKDFKETYCTHYRFRQTSLANLRFPSDTLPTFFFTQNLTKKPIMSINREEILADFQVLSTSDLLRILNKAMNWRVALF